MPDQTRLITKGKENVRLSWSVDRRSYIDFGRFLQLLPGLGHPFMTFHDIEIRKSDFLVFLLSYIGMPFSLHCSPTLLSLLLHP